MSAPHREEQGAVRLPPPPRPARVRAGRLALVAGSLLLTAVTAAFLFPSGDRELPLWFWPAFFGLTLAAPLAWIASRVGRERALAARGRAATAIVTGFLPEVGDGRYKKPPGLTYEFRTGDGVSVQGRSRSPKLSTVQIGEKLAALYDPARPARHSLAADLVWIEV